MCGVVVVDRIRANQYQSYGKRTQSRFLNRSFTSCMALRVPSPPAHPRARNQFTILGVKAAVNPIRTGKNKVLCTVYASTSIAYNPSCPC